MQKWIYCIRSKYGCSNDTKLFDHCQKSKIDFVWAWNFKDSNEIPIIAVEALSKFCKKNYPTIRDHLICNCIVLNDGLFKRFFHLFTKFYQPTKPLRNFEDFSGCETFIEDCRNGKYNNTDIIY